MSEMYIIHTYIIIYSNSNSIFIALNLHLKRDSRGTKPRKQKTLMIYLRQIKGWGRREKPGEGEIRVCMHVQRDGF